MIEMYLSNEPLRIEKSYKYFTWNVKDGISKNLSPLLSKRIRYSSFLKLNDALDSRIVLKNNKGEILEEKLETIWQWIDSSRKIASFTIVPDSTIMWAHYANNSTGYMLEYKNLSLHKVTYSTNPIVFLNFDRLVERGVNYCRLNGYKDADIYDKEKLINFFHTDHLLLESTARAFLTKHIDWIYEKEYRCFGDIQGDLSDSWIDGMEKREIKSITFGKNFNFTENHNELIEIISKEVEKTNLRLYLAKEDFNNNKIMQQEISINEFMKIVKME